MASSLLITYRFNAILLAFLLFPNWVFSEGEDVGRCLQDVKNSLSDPYGKLNSWSLSNTSDEFLCKFDGVSCWTETDSRLLVGLQLQGLSLIGNIPDSFRYCHNLQILDLSNNTLSGSVPSQICTWMPRLFTLDLSQNDLTGGIPVGLVNCKHLSNLILDDNRLSGNIPQKLSNLKRLKRFSAANNDLSGWVPAFVYNQSLELNLSGNNGLQAGPVGKEKPSTSSRLSKKSLAIIIAAGVARVSFSLLLCFCSWWWCNYRDPKLS